MTPRPSNRSPIVQQLAALAACATISASCARRSDADTGLPGPRAPLRPGAAGASPATPSAASEDHAAPPRPPPEACIGVADRGIWSDLDDRIQIELPAGLTADRVTARVDDRHRVLVLSIDGVARKVYPLGGPAALAVGDRVLALRPGDRGELAGLVTAERLTSGPPAHDRDDDGIPDALDVLIGAKKTVANADAYTPEAEDYIAMSYPMGDVPRTIGVCTDVIIRAVRNAGIDLQKELHDDIRRARAAYPMVKGMGDPSIDQRRVGTLLPYFRRHWEAHTARLDDGGDPLRPGDILFLDTFPSRPGPDHIGIVSDRPGASGSPLVINNWTDGTVTAEMDLLAFVPVLYRFRLPQ
jgi:uncharacterized protein YijF (DUF1287 family)